MSGVDSSATITRAEPSPGSSFWRTVKRLDKSKINNLWLALRNSLGVALPLGFGIATGNPLGAVAVATGALNVSFSDGRDSYLPRGRRMVVWSVLGALAAFIGSVAGAHSVATVLIAAVWAFAAGMLIALGSSAGDLGLNTLVTLIVFSGRGPSSLRGATNTGLLVLAGGFLQAAFATIFWPVRRYEPERRTLTKVYLELARVADPDSDASVTIALDPPSDDEQDTIAALGSDHTVEGERFRLLFDQADRLRLSIYLISRLRDELGERDNQDSEAEGDAAEHLDALRRLAADLLKTVGDCLLNNTTSGFDSQLDELRRLAESAQEQTRTAAFPLASSIASAVDMLGGQLRLVAQLTENAAPVDVDRPRKPEPALPLKLQLASWTATIKANLDLNSAVCRHAIRLSVCIAAGASLERMVSWQRAYWLPMTIAVVLKPDFTATFSRGVLRLLGTFAGLVLATALYLILPPSALAELLLVGVFTFFLRYLGPANYGVFSVAVSGLVVFLVAVSGTAPGGVVTARALNTAAGGALALIVYALWPTWERTQVSEALADMMEASRLYLQSVFQRFGAAGPVLARLLDQRRLQWRRARSNAEASVDRVVSEPGITAAKSEVLLSILASSHALVKAIMGLEAGMLHGQTHTAPAALQVFAKDVDFTLYFLASALRGSHPASNSLPQLREDHRRLLEARASFSANDEYILIETDRLTVSLNTLREQVMRYVAG